MSKIKDIDALNQTFKSLEKRLERFEKAMDANTDAVEEVNAEVDEAKIAAQKIKESELNRGTKQYPLVQSSDPAIELNSELIIKKLNIL